MGKTYFVSNFNIGMSKKLPKTYVKQIVVQAPWD